MKTIKFLALLCFILLLSFPFLSCKNNEAAVTEIMAPQSIVLDDDVVELPAISFFYSSGKVVQAAYGNFWFESEYTFVQDNRIIVKAQSPVEFNDTLKIIFRDNNEISADVELIKPFVPLEKISLHTSSEKNECIAGESVKIISSLTPKNASNKKLLYEIVQGSDYAAVQSDGVLSVNKNTHKDSQIIVKASSAEGVFSQISVTVTERIKIYSATEFLAIKNNPNENYSLEADIDFNELSHKLPIPNFGGTLQGNGFSISNFHLLISKNGISRNVYYGLFGQLTGHLENFNVKNSSITFSDQNINRHNGSGFMAAGIVVGFGSGSITNVSVYSSRVEVHRYRSEIGGIAGGFRGKIQKCNVYDIILRGNGDQGGIAGGFAGFISDCAVDTKIQGNKNEIWHFAVNKSRSIGGLVGFSNGGITEHSRVYNTHFVLDGDTVSDGIATNMGYGIGHVSGGVVHKIDSSAENGNTNFTTLRSSNNKEWQKSYFRLAWGQIGIVTDNPIIN